MSRTELKKVNSKKSKFIAEVSRFSVRGKLRLVLLLNVFDVGQNRSVADHTWIKANKNFLSVAPSTGDIIEFNAIVKKYKKNSKIIDTIIVDDYCLRYITNIKVVRRNYASQKEQAG